jgi:hypothetical protein
MKGCAMSNEVESKAARRSRVSPCAKHVNHCIEPVVRPLPDCTAPTAGQSPYTLPRSQFLRGYCGLFADPFRKKSSPKTPGTTGFSALQPTFCIFAGQKHTPLPPREAEWAHLPFGGPALVLAGTRPATSGDHGRLPLQQPPRLSSLSSFLSPVSYLLSPVS